MFGQTGAFGWEDACRLVLEHPLHPSFFVTKLWSYFIPTAPSAAQVDALAKLYVDSGHEIRPVLEAILRAPELYASTRMVKPPIVFVVGMLRATGQAITSDGWAWMCSGAGQKLFYPPDVSGLGRHALAGHVARWPAAGSSSTRSWRTTPPSPAAATRRRPARRHWPPRARSGTTPT